jgi:putative endonuclease
MIDNFYYVYILLSQKDGKKYTGYTKDLFLRFKAHNDGNVQSTKNRRPLEIIYLKFAQIKMTR